MRSVGAGCARADHERARRSSRALLRRADRSAACEWCIIDRRRGAGADRLADVRVDDEAGRRIDRIFFGAAAGAEHERRDAERLAVDRGDAAGPQLRARSRCAGFGSTLPGESHTRGSPPCAATTLRNTSSARPSASACCDLRAAVFAASRATPPSTSISPPSTCTSSRVSAGPPPRSISIDSRISSALPIVRPIGASMSVSTHVMRLPARVADRAHQRAQRPRVARSSS